MSADRIVAGPPEDRAEGWAALLGLMVGSALAGGLAVAAVLRGWGIRHDA